MRLGAKRKGRRTPEFVTHFRAHSTLPQQFEPFPSINLGSDFLPRYLSSCHSGHISCHLAFLQAKTLNLRTPHFLVKHVQPISIRPFPGLVNSVPAVAYHFWLNLPATFSVPGNGLIVKPCSTSSGRQLVAKYSNSSTMRNKFNGSGRKWRPFWSKMTHHHLSQMCD